MCLFSSLYLAVAALDGGVGADDGLDGGVWSEGVCVCGRYDWRRRRKDRRGGRNHRQLIVVIILRSARLADRAGP